MDLAKLTAPCVTTIGIPVRNGPVHARFTSIDRYLKPWLRPFYVSHQHDRVIFKSTI